MNNGQDDADLDDDSEPQQKLLPFRMKTLGMIGTMIQISGRGFCYSRRNSWDDWDDDSEPGRDSCVPEEDYGI